MRMCDMLKQMEYVRIVIIIQLFGRLLLNVSLLDRIPYDAVSY